MLLSIFSRFPRQLSAGLIGLTLAFGAAAAPDTHGAPDKFVIETANSVLDALKNDPKLTNGDLTEINKAVDQYILPYVDFIKTTRLAAGRAWRQATPDQQNRLAQAFRGTLVRTYSGALARVDAGTRITLLPFRGDPKASDVVVGSQISQSNGQPVRVDYRLEKTAGVWKIYDLNVEGIWLIENYRNQFTQQINQNGVEGLIDALNQRNR